jgi:hypothetical protein
VPVGRIGDYAGPSRCLAQHNRLGAAGLRQRNAGFQQGAPQITVPI